MLITGKDFSAWGDPAKFDGAWNKLSPLTGIEISNKVIKKLIFFRYGWVNVNEAERLTIKGNL
jgi:hypothetical protein